MSVSITRIFADTDIDCADYKCYNMRVAGQNTIKVGYYKIEFL